MNFKKIPALLMCLLTAFSSFILPAGAEIIDLEQLNSSSSDNTIYTYGYYEYEIAEDNTASITGYTGNDTEIIIPDTFGETAVTSIDRFAFYCCESLTRITIPDSITSIYPTAFLGCTLLEEINVSPQNKYYSSMDGVLYNKNKTNLIRCPQQRSDTFTVPDSVTCIGKYAFCGCKYLTEINISNSVTSIIFGAFFGCESLTHISIPNSVQSIGQFAFSGCISLTSIAIPERIESISEGLFFYCSSLTNVIIPDSVTSIGGYAFAGCTSLANIIVPDNVVDIERYAFAGCTSLMNIIIPSSVTYIGDMAFEVYYETANMIIPEGIAPVSVSVYGSSCGDETYNFTIYGFAGSYAETYANEHGFNFVDISLNKYLKNFGMRFYTTAKNNTIYIDELELIGGAYFGGNPSGIYAMGMGEVEWEFSNPDLFEIVHSDKNITSITLKGKKTGTSEITLKINGQKMISDVFTVKLSDKLLNELFKDEVLSTAEKQLLDSGLKVCGNILYSYSSDDISIMSFMKALSDGKEILYRELLPFSESTQELSVDNIINDFMNKYFALNTDANDFIQQNSELYEYVSSFAEITQLYNSINKNEIINDISKRSKYSKKDLEKIFDSVQKKSETAFEVTDISVKQLEIISTFIMISQYNKNTVDDIIDALYNTPTGRNSELYYGLCRLSEKLNDPDYVVQTFFNENTLEALNFITEEIFDSIDGMDTYNIYFKITKFLGAIYEIGGGVTADDYLDAMNAYGCACTIRNVLRDMSPYKNIACMYDLYTAAVQTTLEYCIDIAPKTTSKSTKEQIAKRKTYKEQAEQLLSQINNSSISYNILLKKIETRASAGITDSFSYYTCIPDGNTFACYDDISKIPVHSSNQAYDSEETDDTAYISDIEMIKIPTVIDNKTVTGIADNGYSGIQDKKGIILPSTIEIIGNHAFSDCSNVTVILLGDNVKSIGDNAFSGCTSLNMIDIPDSVTSIGTEAFSKCTSLKQININAEKIGSKAFEGCISLEYVTITDRKADIAEDAFEQAKPDLIIIGYKNSTAEEFARSHNIEFSEIPEYVESIYIASEPEKRLYNKGDKINTEGLSLNVTYLDGRNETVTDGWLISCDTSSLGEQQVTVYYKDAQISYPITVVSSSNNIPYAINYDNYILLCGDTVSLNVTNTDTGVNINSSVEWESENPNIAQIDSKGYVWAVNVGETYVTAVIPDDNTSIRCKITVTGTRKITLDNGESECITFSPMCDSIYKLNIDTNSESIKWELYSSNGISEPYLDNDIQKSIYTMYSGKTYILKLHSDKNTSADISISKIDPFDFNSFETDSATDTDELTDNSSDTDTITDPERNNISDTSDIPDTPDVPDSPDTPDVPTPTYRLGDIDGDGKISAKDSLLIQRYAIHLKQLDDAQLLAADVNGDGKVTNKDALSILRFSIGYKVEGLTQ